MSIRPDVSMSIGPEDHTSNCPSLQQPAYLQAFIWLLPSAKSSVHQLKSLKSDSVTSETERFTSWLSSWG